ncbi:MAG: hypothetical protein BWX90_00992 [bacterium ADurb.Bin132]|nr:MAG: hypothetical protein BWX90_00992 [bacterium ADurb.Bin132]
MVGRCHHSSHATHIHAANVHSYIGDLATRFFCEIKFVNTIVSVECSGIIHSTVPQVCCKIIGANYFCLIFRETYFSIFVKIITFGVHPAAAARITSHWHWCSHCSSITHAHMDWLIHSFDLEGDSPILPDIDESVVARLLYLHVFLFGDFYFEVMVLINRNCVWKARDCEPMHPYSKLVFIATAVLEFLYCAVK